jgi:putative tricarboxylic transport membrane protein
MLGGLMMWGLRPGPLLFEKNPDFVWGLIASLYLANVLLLVLNVAFIPAFVRALRMPYTILMSLIVVFCITGAYAQNNKLWDVGQMLVFGVLGYLMRRLDHSPAALTLALVLGPLAERALPGRRWDAAGRWRWRAGPERPGAQRVTRTFFTQPPPLPVSTFR